jgi:hypothetical protein
MLNTLMLNANRKIATTSVKVVWAIAINERQMAFAKKAINSGVLLSNLVTSHPEKGSPIKELIGIVNRIVPNWASLKLKSDRIVGILDAQLAKLKPERKKKTLREILCLLINCIVVKIKLQICLSFLPGISYPLNLTSDVALLLRRFDHYFLL